MGVGKGLIPWGSSPSTPTAPLFQTAARQHASLKSHSPLSGEYPNKQKTKEQKNKTIKKIPKDQDLSNKTVFTFYTLFSFVFRITLSPLSEQIFASHHFYNTETRKNVWTIPSNILALLSLSLSLCITPQAPTRFPPFHSLFLSHLLWVGGAHTLLIRDPLADQILSCLR